MYWLFQSDSSQLSAGKKKHFLFSFLKNVLACFSMLEKQRQAADFRTNLVDKSYYRGILNC